MRSASATDWWRSHWPIGDSPGTLSLFFPLLRALYYTSYTKGNITIWRILGIG